MRHVKCYECGKKYDYDEDGFCPRCGAFTQPARTSGISLDGSVIRAEGLNERNHGESFVHEEYHSENRKRRGSPLEDKSRKRSIPKQKIYRNVGGRLPNQGWGGIKSSGVLGDIITEVYTDILSLK